MDGIGAQWAHQPKFVEHTPDGERWLGFDAARELVEISAPIGLIALPGHTRGHACVPVDAGHRRVLHAGDAFYHHGTRDRQSKVPRVLPAMESLLAADRKRVRNNHSRLAELFGRVEPGLSIVCSHDPTIDEIRCSGMPVTTASEAHRDVDRGVVGFDGQSITRSCVRYR